MSTATDPLFAIRDLSVLQYANGFTLWHYKVRRISDIFTPNYFADSSGMMQAGDHLHVSAPDGNALLAVVKAGDGSVEVRKLCA